MTITIICSRSGLTFEAENRRRKVHPQISNWTAHKDYDTRATAVAVIEKGKAEGWQTLEQFEKAIEAALKEEPQLPAGHIVSLRQASRVGAYRKPWIALITGQSEIYGYARQFMKPFESEHGGTWKFALVKDGVYEVCDRNSAGAERRSWLKVENNVGTDLTQEEAEALTGPPAETQKGYTNKLPLAGPDEEAVEECWECGARYTEYGYVAVGNMSCRSCD